MLRIWHGTETDKLSVFMELILSWERNTIFTQRKKETNVNHWVHVWRVIRVLVAMGWPGEASLRGNS